MPLITTNVDALPEAFRFIVRLLIQKKEAIHKEEIKNLISPSGLVEVMSDQKQGPSSAGQLIVERSLDQLVRAGVVEENGDHCQLTPSVSDHFAKWEDVTAADFSEFLFREVISRTKSKDFNEGDQANLASAFAFLLHVPNPLEPKDFDSYILQKQPEILGKEANDWPIVNREQCIALITWGKYFKVCTQGFTGASSFFIEPSAAFEKPISEVLETEMPIPDFLDKLGKAVSFTDRGEIGKAAGRDWKRKSRHLSPGLALALKVLHLQKKIELKTNAGDAALYRFEIEEGKDETFSHIAPGGKS